MKEFKGKVAVITGASSGIGRALAEHSAKQGMKVVLADIDKKALAQAEKELKSAGASVMAVMTDVSKAEDVQALAKKTLDKFGAAHLLCNAAGVHTLNSIAEATLADWKWVVGVNLYGTIYGVEAFLPIMFKQDTECHIVNVTSVLGGFYALPFNGPYNVSQFGVVTLSETLYLELAAKYPKIKVSLLAPDYIDTGVLDSEQHRPAELRNAPAKETVGGSFPYFEKMTDIIRATVQSETPPQRLADIVFAAIKDEIFYIFPHPESKIIMRDRLERVQQERDPENILKLMGIVS
jgi:NAD(P)-dependent dehydrogenase (short-subunit alcohol dehydrogenase family)